MPSQKKRDPLFMELKDQLLLNVNPSSIKYIGKLRQWQRNFNLLKKMHLAWLYDLLKSDSGLIINHKIEYRLFADSRKYIFMKELWDFDLDYRKTGWYSSFYPQLSSLELKGFL